MVEVQAGLRFEVDSRICFNNPARRSMNIGLVDERWHDAIDRITALGLING